MTLTRKLLATTTAAAVLAGSGAATGTPLAAGAAEAKTRDIDGRVVKINRSKKVFVVRDDGRRFRI